MPKKLSNEAISALLTARMTPEELLALLERTRVKTGWSMLNMRRALLRQWGEAGWYERWPAFSLVLSEVLRRGEIGHAQEAQ